MLMGELHGTGTSVLLLEPNVALRSAVVALLSAEGYDVRPCSSFEQVLMQASEAAPPLALVAWQSMNGLLAEEHRCHLRQVARRLRLVLMVPRRWARLLEQTDIAMAVTGLIAKPFEADELLEAVGRALAASPADAPVA
jgi:DNA-binding response OmpR family regulator